MSGPQWKVKVDESPAPFASSAHPGAAPDDDADASEEGGDTVSHLLSVQRRGSAAGGGGADRRGSRTQSIMNTMGTRDRRRVAPASLDRWRALKRSAAWNLLLLLLVLYNLFSIPIRAAFYYEHDFDAAILVLNYLTDVVLWIDIANRVRAVPHLRHAITAGLRDRLSLAGLARYRAKKGRAAEATDAGMYYTPHVTSWWIVFDIVTLLPIDVVAVLVGSRSVSFWRLHRLLRFFSMDLYTIPFLTMCHRLGERALVESAGGPQTEEIKKRGARRARHKSGNGGHAGGVRGTSKTVKVAGSGWAWLGVLYMPGLRRVMKLFMYMLIASNFAGCGFWLIHRVQITRGFTKTWATEDPVMNLNAQDPWDTQLFDGWVRSLYWAVITQVTTGLGDIAPLTEMETGWTTLMMFMGVAITCAAVGNLTNLVANLDSAHGQFQRRLDFLSKYMEYRALPSYIRSAIINFHRYTWKQYKGTDGMKVFADVPEQLRREVMAHATLHVVSHIPVFVPLDRGFLNNLCAAMRHDVYSPGDYIVNRNVTSDTMYILSRGSAERSVAADLQRVLRGIGLGQGKLESGDYFNVANAIRPMKVLSSVRATSYCEMYELDHPSFEAVVAKSSVGPADVARLLAFADDSYRRVMQVQQQIDSLGFEKESARNLFAAASPSSGAAAAAADEAASPLNGASSHHCMDGSQPGTVMMILQQKLTRDIPRLHPSSVFRLGWRFLRFVVLMWNLLTLSYGWLDIIPARDPDTWMLCMYYVVDVFLLVDIKLRYTYFWYVDNGVVIKSPSRIALKYRKKSFWLDVVASIPFDLVVLADPSIVPWLPLLRVNRMLRVKHLVGHLKRFNHFVDEVGIQLSNPARRIVVIFLFLFIGLHLLGVFFYMSGQISQKEGLTSWIDEDSKSPLFTHNGAWGYIRAVYFCMVAMTTVGYGDVKPANTHESVYSTIIVLIGGLVYPGIVGAVASLMINLDAATVLWKRKVDLVKTYLTLQEVPSSLHSRVDQYFAYVWAQQRGLDEDEILNQLPRVLRTDVASVMNMRIVASVPCFQMVSPNFMKLLVSSFEPMIYLPNDWIIRGGTPQKEMYLLRRGRVTEVSSDGVVLSMLFDGAYFGEYSLVDVEDTDLALKPTSFRAMVYCDCFVLTRASFERVCAKYPDQSGVIGRMIREGAAARHVQRECEEENLKLRKKFERHNIRDEDNLLPATEEEAETWAARHGVSLPVSWWRLAWEAFAWAQCVYSVFVIPFRIAFISNRYTGYSSFSGGLLVWFLVEYLLDLLWAGDIWVRLTRLSFLKDGSYEFSPSAIYERYRHSTAFYVDVAAALPIDIFVLLMAVPSLNDSLFSGNGNTVLLASCLRIPKLLRLSRYTQYVASVEMLVREKMQWSVNVFRMSNLFLMLILICHQFACMFFFIAVYLEPTNGNTYLNDGEILYDTWVDDQLRQKYLAEEAHALSAWVRAINWALPTIVVVVIGDVVPVTEPETLFVIFTILVGITLNATVVGNVAEVIGDINTQGAEYRAEKDNVDKHMKAYHFPETLQNRVRAYYDFKYTLTHGLDTESVVSSLPPTIRADFELFRKYRLIRTAPFFEHCDDVMTREFALACTSRIVCPGDLIIEEGAMGHEMYFLEQGMADVLTIMSVHSVGKEIIHRTMGPGSFFGESACFLKQPRSASVRAVGYCFIFVLHMRDVDRILDLKTQSSTGAAETKLDMVSVVRSMREEKQREFEERKKKMTIVATKGRSRGMSISHTSASSASADDNDDAAAKRPLRPALERARKKDASKKLHVALRAGSSNDLLKRERAEREQRVTNLSKPRMTEITPAHTRVAGAVPTAPRAAAGAADSAFSGTYKPAYHSKFTIFDGKRQEQDKAAAAPKGPGRSLRRSKSAPALLLSHETAMVRGPDAEAADEAGAGAGGDRRNLRRMSSSSRLPYRRASDAKGGAEAVAAAAAAAAPTSVLAVKRGSITATGIPAYNATASASRRASAAEVTAAPDGVELVEKTRRGDGVFDSASNVMRSGVPTPAANGSAKAKAGASGAGLSRQRVHSRRGSSAATAEAVQFTGTVLNRSLDEEGPRTLDVFMPGSGFVWAWHIAALTIIVYFVVVIIFRVSFWNDANDVTSWQHDHVTPLFAVDYAFDVFFIFDIVLKFGWFAEYEDATARLVDSRAAIRRRYLRGDFLLDAVASFPYEVLCPFVRTGDFSRWAVARLPKLLRMLRLGAYLRLVDRYLEIWSVRVSAGVLSIVKVMFVYLVATHWFGCMWIIIGRYIEHDRSFTWMTVYDVMDAPLRTQYLRAVHFALTTLSSVGYGDIRPTTDLETVFQLVQVTTGALLFASLIGTYAVRFSVVDSTGYALHMRQRKTLNVYMHYLHLPYGLRLSILNNFHFRWVRMNGTDDSYLRRIPGSLQRDVAWFIRSSLIAKVRLFREAESRYLSRVMAGLTSLSVSAGDYVFLHGDLGDEVFVIAEGTAEVVDDLGVVLATYLESSYFGVHEYEPNTNIRSVNVRAATPCNLLVLKRAVLTDIAAMFPEFRASPLYLQLTGAVSAHGQAAPLQRAHSETDIGPSALQLRRAQEAADGAPSAGSHAHEHDARPGDAKDKQQAQSGLKRYASDFNMK